MRKSKLFETNYIIGIDFGNETTKVSYLDHITKKPTIYDVSGGYSLAHIPSALQYIPSENKWLFGEAAKQRYGEENTVKINNILESLQVNQEFLINQEVYLSHDIIKVFLSKIFESINQLNPKAVIEKVVIAIDKSLYANLKEIIEKAMESFNTEYEIINNLYGIVKYLQYINHLEQGETLLFDYGHQYFRSYSIIRKEDFINFSYICENKFLAGENLQKALLRELITLFCKEKNLETCTRKDEESISQLLKQSMAIIFQKYIKNQPIRIYYNFTFPPFQKTISSERIAEILYDYKKELSLLMNHIGDEEIRQFILTGNGFKMIWPKLIIEEKAQRYYIDSEILAKGCAIVAGSNYIELEDIAVGLSLVARKDYSIAIKNNPYISIIHKGQALFKRMKSHILLIEKENDVEPTITIVSQEPGGCIVEECSINLDFTNHFYNVIKVNFLVLIHEDGSIAYELEYLSL